MNLPTMMASTILIYSFFTRIQKLNEKAIFSINNKQSEYRLDGGIQ